MYPIVQQQLALPMLTLYEGPKLLPLAVIATAHTFRQAVLLCQLHATRKKLSQARICDDVNELMDQQAVAAGIPAGPRMRSSHLTEYLSASDTSRDMPARFVPAFEIVMGNRAITQWQTMAAGLHHYEQLLVEQRRVA